MLTKSLVIFIGIGVIAGFAFGVYLTDLKNTNQLVFVEGPSLSVVTQKSEFEKGEDITIKIVNSGTVPLVFSDTSYGLRVTGLSGILMYSPQSYNETPIGMHPGGEAVFLWNQTKNDGNAALEGLYKISAKGVDELGETVERSVTVIILK